MKRSIPRRHPKPVRKLGNAKHRARAALSCVLVLASSVAWSQTYTVLHNFGGTTNLDGAGPAATLTASGETLYGTTVGGGDHNQGTIFRINTAGSGYQVLFHGNAPYNEPEGPLVLSGERLYCTTKGISSFGTNYPWPIYTYYWGSMFGLGTNGSGFQSLIVWGEHIDPGGRTPIGPPGGHPEGLLLLGATFYGIGQETGQEHSSIFRVGTNGGDYALLANLDGISAAGLVAAGTTLFGTTFDGGSNSLGTVFAVDAVTGHYTQLKAFAGPDGAAPYGGLVIGDGKLYGTTESGGQFGKGTVFSVKPDGTEFTVLKHFSGTDGAYPHSELSFSAARLYGTTRLGGAFGHGTVFQIQTNGAAFAVLKSFSGADGDEPFGGLVLLRDTLYGTAGGGDYGLGVVFSLQLNPVLSSPVFDGTNFLFSFQTLSNLTYTVETACELSAAAWEPLSTVIGDGSRMQCVVPMTNPTATFFRVGQR